jgi:hypothetical protein
MAGRGRAEKKVAISRVLKWVAETTAAIFALRNAAPDEWRDVKHTEHKHSLQYDQLTDQQLSAIAAGVSPVDAGLIEGEVVELAPQHNEQKDVASGE